MLKRAKGGIKDVGLIFYANVQMMYHLSLSRDEIKAMSDDEWAMTYAVLEDIRQKEMKAKPF